MILVVEDEESIRNQLSEALPMLGFDVSLAVDGLEALKMLETVQPDLILSDIVMPGMTGTELKKELGKEDRFATIPFVFISALSSFSDVREGMMLAADDYVTKPFRMSEMKRVLDAQLAKAQARSRYYSGSVEELVESLQLIFPHEIITPISVIYGFADFLKTLDQSNPKERSLTLEMLDGITSSAERLRQLSDRFTELVKVNLHRMQNSKEILEEPFAYDIAETVKSAAVRVASKQQAKGRLDFRLEPGQVTVLQEAVTRIVGEIVKNAIEYSPEIEFVSITGSSKGQSYYLSIKDQGEGMSKDEISRIGSFVQFGRRSREQQGLGIGLAVTKRLAELIGAEITFTSPEGAGLEVRIRFPLSEELPPSVN